MGHIIEPDGIENSISFNFGIFIKALQSRVVETRDFPYKFSYCFWWGLRNISSLGSNLDTSPFIGEVLFAVFISIFGLILFSLLVGNMQVSTEFIFCIFTVSSLYVII